MRRQPRHRIRSAAPIGLVALAAVIGCSRPADPVRSALDGIVRGAEERDAGAVLDHLAPDFQAADGSGRPDAGATLRQYLAAYESLDVEISDVEIERAAGAARARFTAKLSGSPRKIGGLEGFFPQRSSWRFDLRLAPDAQGRWLVTWAGWEQAE